MVENAAKINYKYGEMAAENAFERQQVLYNRTYPEPIEPPAQEPTSTSPDQQEAPPADAGGEATD